MHVICFVLFRSMPWLIMNRKLPNDTNRLGIVLKPNNKGRRR